MADPIHEVAAIMNSEDPGGSVASVARVPINIGDMSIGPSEVTQDNTPVDENLAISIEDLGISIEEPIPAVTTTKPPKKKVKRAGAKKFSKKKVAATRQWFLKPEHMNDFTDNLVNLVGIIKQCPRKTNDNHYEIDWTGNDGMRLPDGLNPTWLRWRYQNDPKMKDILQQLIIDYEEKGNVSSVREVSTNKHSVGFTTPTKKRAPDSFRYSKAAAVRTSASISTLSVSSRGSRSTITDDSVPVEVKQAGVRRATRSNTFQDETLLCDVLSEDSDLDEENQLGQFELLDSEDEDDPDPDKPVEPIEGDLRTIMGELDWKFEELKEGDPPVIDKYQPRNYDGPEGLRRGVGTLFSNPFECLQVVGGLDYSFVANLAANSNEYYWQEIHPELNKDKRLHNHTFSDISTAEMHWYLGITLKISLAPIDGGGYTAYFRTNEKIICGKTIKNSRGFAYHYMSLWRYQQIRSAFHPESRTAGLGGDKAHQLRTAVNAFNAAAGYAFCVGGYLTFDEGGIACRSRRCPIRQYNPAKPDKFRVEFFVMSCAKNFVIHHLDIYQGKNSANVNIHEDIHSMKTSQKAVLNAVIQCNLQHSTNGSRHIALDNRYQCPELAFILREKYRVLSTGTCRSNRIGWNKAMFNFTKGMEKGLYKFGYDKVNRVLCTQWVDSKAVNCVSTLIDSTVGEVGRQRGSLRQMRPCPNIMKMYQGTMYGVDKGDQMRMHFGGFSNKGHYKKWYKKSFLAVLDMMLLNSKLGWNMSAKDPTLHRQELSRHDFYQYVAESLLEFRDRENPPSPEIVRERRRALTTADGHIHQMKQSDYPKAKCVVCNLEQRWKKSLGQKGLTSNVVECTICGITAHAVVPEETCNRLIHKLPYFTDPQMTCFEILHSPEGYGIWSRRPEGSKSRYMPHPTHPVVIELRVAHGLAAKITRKRRQQVQSESEDEYTQHTEL